MKLPFLPWGYGLGVRFIFLKSLGLHHTLYLLCLYQVIYCTGEYPCLGVQWWMSMWYHVYQTQMREISLLCCWVIQKHKYGNNVNAFLILWLFLSLPQKSLLPFLCLYLLLQMNPFIKYWYNAHQIYEVSHSAGHEVEMCMLHLQGKGLVRLLTVWSQSSRQKSWFWNLIKVVCLAQFYNSLVYAWLQLHTSSFTAVCYGQ